ncbi:MAG: hypothetical protein D6B26_05150, partial [Spirochaetaceae bacterium]
MDCTGAVLATYWGAGIDLAGASAGYPGRNGVAKLYAFLLDSGFIVDGDYPLPGDLIFWDNTYDYNENGLPDDGLTHVGMVVTVASNGDIEYLHHNYRRGIVLEKMNLREPATYSRIVNGQTVVVNSFMRARSAPAYDRRLAGELVNSLGQAYRSEF